MTVTWRITHEGLSGEPVAGHFHGPATPEENAPPVIDLGEGAYGATMDLEEAEGTEVAEAEGTEEEVAQEIMEGSAQLTEEQLADLQAGRYYINIHTEQHPDGEIRGQVVEGEADMDAMQEAAAGGAMQGTTDALQVADIEAGVGIYQESCRNCHGPRAQGMASFPRLAGHDAEYLLGRLHQYHAGEKVGPGSALMIPVAQDLSEEDMANVAAYIASAFE
jgi:cytochrome c553